MHQLLSLYHAKIANSEIESDPAQIALLERMETLLDDIKQQRIAQKSHVLGWLFGRYAKGKPPLKGLYIWGDVGRGKTMLMDLLLSVAPSPARRAHFHEFMIDVHERIFAFRQQVKRGEVKDSDPIPVIATALAQEARFLCFDEFMVRDIADAMILGRLFTALFAHGVVVVATSNVVPSHLYEGGLNRALFLPFLDLLHGHMDVIELKARTDFRMEKIGSEPVYYSPNGSFADDALTRLFTKISGVAKGEPITLPIKGRDLIIAQAHEGVARVSFDDLCNKPLGSADYLAIAHRFHTVFIDNIPIMNEAQRNEAKRFMILIDALYDHRVKVIASAQSTPEKLYTAAFGAEVFEFARTVSRLMEMRSTAYLALPHGRAAPPSQDETTGIIET
jgi:cell division protein ZapE